MSWRQEARCIDLGLQERLLFFGDADYPITTQAQYRWARSFCYECPVQVQCLMQACEDKERTAVYGGLTESQRRRHAVPFFRQFGMNEETAALIIANLGQGITPPPSLDIPDTSALPDEMHAEEHDPIRLPA